MGLGTFFRCLGEKIKKPFSALSGNSFLHKRINTRVVIIIAGAFLVIIALLLVFALVSRRRAGSEQTDGFSASAYEPLLHDNSSSEDFFLPYEPDFVPDVLLEREPKDSWTEEDALPFWTDPLEGNEGEWRKRIESGIDSLLEHVP